ncbi:MAG: metallophosphoesterase [Muribaculaceae bacterium]|nr:metallophosphoesterase [Muribaculaceae bacterium]
MKIITSILLFLMCMGHAHAIKILSGPYLQNVTDNEATIVWRTDSAALSWVEIAPDGNDSFYAESHPRYYATSMGRALIGKLHKITIKNLKPNTTYRYRIVSREVLTEEPYYVAYGETAATDVYRNNPLEFTTPGPNESLDFLVVNDMHADNGKLADLMGNFKKGETDFVLFNGDMVSFMDNENQLFEGFIDKAVELFASETPFLMVRGNHESRGKFAQKYMNYFPTPTGMPYYTVKRGPVFFIFLDGGEDKPDDCIEYYGTAFGDDYRAEQAEWLESVVESDEFKSSPYKIVVCHIPPVGDTWHGPQHAKELWLPILNKSGIDLMLCGHLHRHKFHDKGFEGAKFPVLINSNKDVVKVSANPVSLDFTVTDRSGNTVLSKQITHK